MDTLRGPQMTATENSAHNHNIRLHVLLTAVGNNGFSFFDSQFKGSMSQLEDVDISEGKIATFYGSLAFKISI